jgi:hypothetical protein
MVNYEVLTNKTYEEIKKFFTDAFADKHGVSFKCGFEYYNVIDRVSGSNYLVSKLELTKGGYVKDATSIATITGDIAELSKYIYGIASVQ